MWVRLAGSKTAPDTYICILYCPHAGKPAAKRHSFYGDLLESCSTFAAKGDILLLGDFNARIGTISGDHGTNANGPLLLDFLRAAFLDGDNNDYHCLLNASFGNRGVCTWQKKRANIHHRLLHCF